MKRLVPATALLLFACTTPPPPEPPRIATNYSQASNMVAQFSAETDSKCDSYLALRAQLGVTMLLGDLHLHSKTAFDQSGRLSNPQMNQSLELLNEFGGKSADLLVRFGDAFRKKGCVKEAEEQYNNTMETFTGLSYASYRERAALGISALNRKAS